MLTRRQPRAVVVAPDVSAPAAVVAMAATPASARVSPRLPPDTPSRIASHCAAMYAKGAVAALSMHRVARYASRSKRLRTLAARCVLVNGVVFLGSLAVLDHALVPFIGWVLHEVDRGGRGGRRGRRRGREIPRRERVVVVPVDRARRVAVSDLLREHGGQLVHRGGDRADIVRARRGGRRARARRDDE